MPLSARGRATDDDLVKATKYEMAILAADGGMRSKSNVCWELTSAPIKGDSQHGLLLPWQHSLPRSGLIWPDYRPMWMPSRIMWLAYRVTWVISAEWRQLLSFLFLCCLALSLTTSRPGTSAADHLSMHYWRLCPSGTGTIPQWDW